MNPESSRAALQALAGLRGGRRIVVFGEMAELGGSSERLHRDLGRLVAELDRIPRVEFREQYAADFMAALEKIATPGRNANVLQHAAGHLKKRVEPASRQELAELIHDYRRGLVPLVVPVMLLRHHARVHRVSYLERQTYLEPHPKELMLRNHV